MYNIFTVFFAEVKNHFGKTIKILRSDNAPEYSTALPITQFLNSNGIILQTSCAYTPTQNGVAVRKNHRLLETTRAMMFAMNVPKTYWEDGVLTSCYLINRMPSSVLGNQTQHHDFFPDKDLFSLPPKTFGSACFLHKHGPRGGKLDPKAVKCVFIGYSRTQKGYKYYSPQLRRSFISRDVTFFETESFFSSASSDTELNELRYACIPDSSLISSNSTPVVIEEHIMSREIVNNEPSVCYNPNQVISPDVHVFEHQEPVSPAYSPNDSEPALEPVLSDDLDLPIALRKGKRQPCPNPRYPIS